MRKTLRKDNLAERPAARALLALTLTAALAGFGCTTNRTPGNGDPLQGAPGVGPGAPTSGVNGGSSSGTGTVNPPMTSSSTYNDTLPTVSTRSTRLPLSADEAAAVLAGNRFSRGVRVLGPVNPGNSVRTSASDATGQYQNPAMNLNPIVTVNSSVNSIAHVPAVGGGVPVSDAGAIADAATLTNAIASNAITSNAAVAGTTVANTGGVVFSPSAAGTTLATTSSSSLTPAVAAAGLPSSTVATNATTVASPVRVSQDANGRVTVTNASSKSQ